MNANSARINSAPPISFEVRSVMMSTVAKSNVLISFFYFFFPKSSLS